MLFPVEEGVETSKLIPLRNHLLHAVSATVLIVPDCSLIFLLSQVPKVTHTEFCQGRTMRWALAWSFYDDVIVPVSLCRVYFCPLCT